MNDTDIFVHKDFVAEMLDDMAALGAHWAKNRERGRTPGAIRAAMILVARDLLTQVDEIENENARMEFLRDPMGLEPRP